MLEKSSPDARRDQSFARPAEAADPIAMARRDLNKALPRRFYKEASAGERDGGFVLILDGRAAKSPGGNRLALPCLAAARALADEWSAQGEWIDLASMPLTRIVNSASLHPLRPGLRRMSTRILQCAPGARTRRPFAAARGNGARWKRPHACFRPSMALEHERARVFAK